MPKKYNGHLISAITPGSIAEELGIVPGDRLLYINDTEIGDVFDYRYLINDEEIDITILSAEDGEEWDFSIEKGVSEDLGLTFEAGLMDEYKHCSNKCIFCFIDQMPPGMRETLYFKDDDARLSFLQGNYITLTNMRSDDVEKICFYKLSPINISIHTTNPDLRNKMLNNRNAGKALKLIDKFCEAGIEINGQIVLCKGYNDGPELDRTLSDIEQYIPNLKSLSVVPVGLTKYRDGLCQLEEFTKEDARKVLEQIAVHQNHYKQKYGTGLVFPSDEWFLTAGYDIPEMSYYEGFPQIENGVGMIRSLLDEFEVAITSEKPLQGHPEKMHDGKATFITGKAMEPIIKTLSERIMEKYPQIRIEVAGIRNDFFGEKITVAGLVTCQDIIAQLKDRDLGDFVIIPSCMLRAGERVFLDDLTVDDLEKALQRKVRIVKSNGISLIDVLCDDYVQIYEREVPYEQTDCSNSGQA